MIESLKNTCVMPESQEQARAIVALYEVAGGKIWVDSSLPGWDKENPIGLWEDGDIIHANLVGSKCKRITFTELCGNYGIAPDWAKALVGWGGEYYWRGDELYESLKSGNVFEYSEDSFVASREPISTRPAKQSKRKTLQDALEAYPDGWPVCPDGCVIAERSGVLQPVIESRIDVIGFNKVCTREEFEAAHAKRKTLKDAIIESMPQFAESDDCKWDDVKEWPAPGTLPPVGVECEYHFNEDCIYKGKVIAYHKDAVWFALKDGLFKTFIGNHKFRPIQSERDRLVEQAIAVAANAEAEGGRTFAAALYDAGMLKGPQQ